jgi:hypothetical protein
MVNSGCRTIEATQKHGLYNNTKGRSIITDPKTRVLFLPVAGFRSHEWLLFVDKGCLVNLFRRFAMRPTVAMEYVMTVAVL